MTLTNKILWVIERNLHQTLTLADLAETCGVSRYHLAHAFGEATGQPVMHYLRGRRLTIAAEALASGAPDILCLALDSGYNSHEAFSRAFRAQFGITPEMVRRTATTEDLTMVEPMNYADNNTTELAPPRFVQSEAFLAVGLAQHHPFKQPHNIPIQWQTFMSTLYPDVPHKRDDAPVGISGGMDDDGNFEYVCASEVSKFSDTPRGLIEMTILAQRYAVFRHEGHVSAIGATYDAIWNKGLPASGAQAADAPCIERHLLTFNPKTGMGGVDIWIPIRD